MQGASVMHDTAVARRSIVVTGLGVRSYEGVLNAMQEFTKSRTRDTEDEIWWLQHQPVYTQGLNCKQRTLGPTSIPVVACDRGGQITYHGPGQLVVYTLIDLKRRGKGAKWLVSALEQAVIDFLADHGERGERRPDAPGVYVRGKKLAALGLRIRRGASYHGLSVNVDMDLGPFANIHPCGFKDLAVTQLKDLGLPSDLPDVAARVTKRITELLA